MAVQILIITSDAKLSELLHQLLWSASIEIVLRDTLLLVEGYLHSEMPPQLIILDWAFERSTTPHFLREMRALKRFSELPILVIVPDPDPDIIKEVLRAGATRYLTQNFIQNNLLRTLREMQIKIR